MRYPLRILLALAALLGPLGGSSTYAANADPMDIDVDLQAKIAREKLKQLQAAGQEGSAGKLGKGQDCGKVDIGNANANGSNQSGSRAVNPREQTVVVLGDVVNAATCR